MKIFSAAQVRQWDAFTIDHEPISSINLMERAAAACIGWLNNEFPGTTSYIIVCGTGNNGGDGLAIARMLHSTGHTVSVFILEGTKRSEDFVSNLEKLSALLGSTWIDQPAIAIPASKHIIIDALFGTGLNKPLQGLAADLVEYLNHSGNPIISIDLPSGLFADDPYTGNAVIRASHTLTFQAMKLAFMMAGSQEFTGKVHVMDIGLNPVFYQQTATPFQTIDEQLIQLIYKPRNPHSHKYNFGHALLFAGSQDMMGAAILCASACLRSGAGLATVHTAKETQAVLQIAIPEAITTTDNDLSILLQKKAAIGIGPGLLVSDANRTMLATLIDQYQGWLVIDATALGLLSEIAFSAGQRSLKRAILTPHTGEFDRLFGSSQNDFERMETALQQSRQQNCYIILKGHHTLIACPGGNAFFNTTGNAGMATAGSGDTLTGMLTGLLAQGYSPQDACVLGVYLHGLAGDIAAAHLSQEALIARDIIYYIGAAYKKIAAFRRQ